MALTAKPTSYTLNAGHAKAPTHLWMFDEGTGSTSADKGTGTALTMNLQNGAAWGSDALGTTLVCVSGSNQNAISDTGTIWNPANNVLMVAIAESATAGNVAATEYIFSYGKSNLTTPGIGGMRILTATNTLSGIADDNSVTRTNATSFAFYDATMHMIAVKIQPQASSGEIIAVSMDGSAWDTTPNNTLGTSYTIDRYAVGVRAASTGGSLFNGSILALYVYENGTYATWNDAWIADLYADPWQFLNTTTASAPGLFTVRSAIRLGS